MRQGSVVDHQLGLCVDLCILNCWIAGCQVVLSRRLSSRLKFEFYCFPEKSVHVSQLAGKSGYMGPEMNLKKQNVGWIQLSQVMDSKEHDVNWNHLGQAVDHMSLKSWEFLDQQTDSFSITGHYN